MFGTEVRLQSVDNGVGVSSGCAGSEILVTTLATIRVFDLGLMRATNSWCSVRGRSFTSKAIYDPVTSCYYAVIGSTTLVRWSPDDNRVGREDQSTILSCAALSVFLSSTEPLVLYEDGNIATAKQPFDYLWKNPQTETNILCFSYVHHEASDTTHIGFITEDSGSYIYQHVLVKQADDTTCRHFQNNLSHQGKPTSVNLSEFNGEINLTIAWHDGVVSFAKFEENIKWSYSGVLNAAGFHQPFGFTAFKDIALMLFSEGERVTCLGFSKKFGAELWKRDFVDLLHFSRADWHIMDNGILLLADTMLMLLPLGEHPSLASVIGVKKCAAQPAKAAKFKWTSKGLKKVGKTKRQSSTVDNEQRINELLKRSEFKEATNCLSEYKTVPESLVVNILSVYFAEKDVETQTGSLTSRDPVIDDIISVRFDQVFMVENLTKLTVKQVLYLLRYLYRRLRMVESESIEPDRIIDWITAAVDAHASRLLFMDDPAAVELFSDMCSFVKDRCKNAWNEIELLRDIAVSEERLLRPHLIRMRPSSDSYDIHVLVF